MNLRQHKRFRIGQLLGWLSYLAFVRNCNAGSVASYWAELERKQAVRQLVETDPVEAAKIEYVVAKKSTGEVVGTFDLEEDALAMIEKARKAKKASLVMV